MKAALKERLADSSAKVLVTTPKMATRVPVNDLPDLQHIILVGAEKRSLKLSEVSWEKEMSVASSEGEIEWVDLEDPPCA